MTSLKNEIHYKFDKIKCVCIALILFLRAKGHLISKAIYGLLTSSKKRTDEFDFFCCEE